MPQVSIVVVSAASPGYRDNAVEQFTEELHSQQAG